MMLFGHNKKEMKKNNSKDILPKLPELPRLPDLPSIDQENEKEKISQLPTLPKSSFAEKFSQNSIKEAVSGGRRGEEELLEDMEEDQLEEVPSNNNEEVPREFVEASRKVNLAKPVFIRIDKFQDSLKIFEESKEKIKEIEGLLDDIKRLKEEEEQELTNWEKELKEIRIGIEKINENIFSKI